MEWSFRIFPALPRWVDTVDEALLNAKDALRDYAVETERDGDELARPSPFQTIETPTREPVGVHTADPTIGQKCSGRLDPGRGRRRVHRYRSPSPRYDPQNVHHVGGPAHRGHGWIAPACEVIHATAGVCVGATLASTVAVP